MFTALRRPAAVLMALAVLALAATATRSASLDEWATDLERGSNRLLYKWGIALPGTPPLGDLEQRLKAAGLKLGAPVLVRIFKRESDLELWMPKDGAFVRFATYPVCRWAGELGPKQKLGDKQVPEGFYTVGSGQLNPNSRWFRSFNVGYPNRLDRDAWPHRRFHHGAWRLLVGWLRRGDQRGDGRDLAAGRGSARPGPAAVRRAHLPVPHDRAATWPSTPKSPWAAEWRDLAPGYRLFEDSKVPPVPLNCKGRYNFKPGAEGNDGSQELQAGCYATAGL